MKFAIALLIIMVVLLAGRLIFSRKNTTKLEARLVRAQHAIREASKPDNRPVIVNDGYPSILMYKSLLPQLQAEDRGMFIVALPSFEIMLHIPVRNISSIDNIATKNVIPSYGIIISNDTGEVSIKGNVFDPPLTGTKGGE